VALSLNPKDAGAESAIDVGIFCVGAAAGGLVDAALNLFGFAEPFVVAPLGGAGALGLKKLLWDSWRRTPSRRAVYGELRAEAALVEETGAADDAALLRQLVDAGEAAGTDPATIRKVYQERRRGPYS